MTRNLEWFMFTVVLLMGVLNMFLIFEVREQRNRAQFNLDQWVDFQHDLTKCQEIQTATVEACAEAFMQIPDEQWEKKISGPDFP